MYQSHLEKESLVIFFCLIAKNEICLCKIGGLNEIRGKILFFCLHTFFHWYICCEVSGDLHYNRDLLASGAGASLCNHPHREGEEGNGQSEVIIASHKVLENGAKGMAVLIIFLISLIKL